VLEDEAGLLDDELDELDPDELDVPDEPPDEPPLEGIVDEL